MSHRLQVLISEELDNRLAKEAQRSRISKGEWVRRVLIEAVEGPRRAAGNTRNPLERLFSVDAPTADIEQMLDEINTGRGTLLP